jgi:hypothetical protein
VHLSIVLANEHSFGYETEHIVLSLLSSYHVHNGHRLHYPRALHFLASGCLRAKVLCLTFFSIL